MALTYNGSTQYTKMSANTDYSPPNSSPISLSCWFKTSDGTNRSSIVSKGGTNGVLGTFQWGLMSNSNGNKLSAETYQSSGSLCCNVGTNTVVADGKWHHAVMIIVDDTSVTLYLDNVKSSSSTVTGDMNTDTTAPVEVARRDFNDTYFNGTVAEVALWKSIALTDNEVTSLFRGIPAYVLRRATLTGYWPLFGVSTTEADLSGLGRNGTDNNTPTKANHIAVIPWPNVQAFSI